MDHLHLRTAPLLGTLYGDRAAGSLRWTGILLALWCLMSTLEWVGNLDLFRPDGLLSWRILSLRTERVFRAGRVQSLVWDRSVPWVLSARIVASIALVVSLDGRVQCAALSLIVASSWFLNRRTWLGEDGADQMGQIVSIGALLIATGQMVDELSLSFAGSLLIAGQLGISYFFSGFDKLRSPEWRRGQAVVGVMGTHSYGHAIGARLAGGSASLSIAFCWSVMLIETLFPLALVAPPGVCLTALTLLLLFHLGTAYLMGLNTFVWAFASAYPSALLLNGLVARALGWDA